MSCRPPSAVRTRLRRRVQISVVVALLVVLGMTWVPPVSAEATGVDPASDVATMLGLVNGKRIATGRTPLILHATLVQSAQGWADHMAKTGVLAHDTKPVASLPTGWIRYGENVGTGPTAELVWGAFMASPSHLGTIVDPGYTHVGIAVAHDSTGRLWVAQRFLEIPPVVVTVPPAGATPITVPTVTLPAPTTTIPTTVPSPPPTNPPVTSPIAVTAPTTSLPPTFVPVADPSPTFPPGVVTPTPASPTRAAAVLLALGALA